MKWSKYLGDKPFWRVTLALAIPVALQNVLTSSFQLGSPPELRKWPYGKLK